MTRWKPCAAAALAALLAPAVALAVPGGTDTPITTAPYTAWLGGRCTGTLITPTRILTAGHCLDGASASEVRVLVGVDGNLLTPRRQAAAAVPVRGYSVHPRFGEAFPFRHDSPENAIAVNDVGLILLKRPVTAVQPIRIAGPADGASEAPGAAVTMLGYGATRQAVPLTWPNPTTPPQATRPTPLQRGALTVIGPGECAQAYPRVITTHVLCTRDLVDHRPLVMACPGDSGGPVVASTTSGPVQVGVTSWGAEVKNGPCGDTLLPNVPMRVSAFRGFITQARPPIEPYTADGSPDAAGGATAPTIAGVARVGRTVSCRAPKLAGDRFTVRYGWTTVQRSGSVDIKGAHARRLKITPAIYRQTFHLARRITCKVSAANAGGTLRLESGSKAVHR